MPGIASPKRCFLLKVRGMLSVNGDHVAAREELEISCTLQRDLASWIKENKQMLGQV